MKKYFYLFFILISLAGIFHPFTSHAQLEGQFFIDSLQEKVSTVKEDSIKVRILNELSYAYWSIDPKKGNQYGSEALFLAEKNDWKIQIAFAYRNIGVNQFIQSDNIEGHKNLLKAFNLFEKSDDAYDAGSCINWITLVIWSQHLNDKALENSLHSIEYNTQTNNRTEIAWALNNTGVIYNDEFHQPDKCLEYLFDALRIFKEIHNEKGIAVITLNIGWAYENKNDLPNAELYYRKSLESAMKINEKNNIALIYNNLGDINLKHALKSPVVAKQKSDFLNESEKNYRLSLDIVSSLNDNRIITHIYQSLATIDSIKGNFNSAYENYKRAFNLNDSIVTNESSHQIAEMQTKYETAEKDNEIQLQTKEINRQKLMRNFIGGGLIILILFLGIVYRQRNKISKEKKRSELLLLNILPAETANELKLKGHADAKTYSMVTVMFTDFAEFTNVSEKVSAELLVSEIDFCFSAFDNIIQKYSIEKIKTVGDAYICTGGLPVLTYTHAADIINAAIEIRDFMIGRKKQKELKGEIPFEIRIGIHTGPVVAGIVGIKKFAYDIWGDTVNIASRMESSSEAGKINVSGTTYDLVKDKFQFTYREKLRQSTRV